MTDAQKIKKLEKDVRELKSLFSALAPLDKEGEYKDSFVRQMKKTSSEKVAGRYAGKGSLMNLTK